MSREIDMADPGSWTDEDRQYLQDRAMLPSDEEVILSPSISTELAPNTGDVNTPKPNSESDTAKSEALDTYRSYNLEELKDELRGRGLPVSGTKNELVYRLAADDQTPDDEPVSGDEVADVEAEER